MFKVVTEVENVGNKFCKEWDVGSIKSEQKEYQVIEKIMLRLAYQSGFSCELQQNVLHLLKAERDLIQVDAYKSLERLK